MNLSKSSTLSVSLYRGLFIVCLLALSALASSDAVAQRGQPRVIQLEEIRIEGRVQKPNAFYILNRSNLGYEVLDLRTSFVREIIESVRRRPF